MTTQHISKEEAGRRRFDDPGAGERHTLDLKQLDAFLVDLDGVVTDTASLHAEAWRKMFDAYLSERAACHGGVFHPFDKDADYRKYVDGKPRYDGVASFLQSRDIYLPPGDVTDPPDKETICGLGNRKNQLYLEAVRQRGPHVYPSSVRFLRRVKAAGLRLAVVTASRNCSEILEAAGIADLFDAQVDGVVAREWLLEGKPAPDTFLEAAHRLDVAPCRACVIEDAVSGVQAGKAGAFELVIGVSRDGHPERLAEGGADIVVSDLGDLDIGNHDSGPAVPLPHVSDHLPDIEARIRERRVAVFLDYDGTLSDIVPRPEDAVISEETRATVQALADICPVVIVSGRALDDVRRKVGLDRVVYAGSHGFDIAGPEGAGLEHAEGAAYVPAIAQAVKELHGRLDSIDGVIIEDKTYAVAVHYRMVKTGDVGRVARAVNDVLADHPSLRGTGGKKVFEIRPGLDWDKGKAVLWLLHALGLDGPDVVPFYLGDDVTDEDAFRALHGSGLSILVAERQQDSRADYCLANPAEVRAFLQRLRDILREREA